MPETVLSQTEKPTYVLKPPDLTQADAKEEFITLFYSRRNPDNYDRLRGSLPHTIRSKLDWKSRSYNPSYDMSQATLDLLLGEHHKLLGDVGRANLANEINSVLSSVGIDLTSYSAPVQDLYRTYLEKFYDIDFTPTTERARKAVQAKVATMNEKAAHTAESARTAIEDKVAGLNSTAEQSSSNIKKAVAGKVQSTASTIQKELVEPTQKKAAQINESAQKTVADINTSIAQNLSNAAASAQEKIVEPVQEKVAAINESAEKKLQETQARIKNAVKESPRKALEALKNIKDTTSEPIPIATSESPPSPTPVSPSTDVSQVSGNEVVRPSDQSETEVIDQDRALRETAPTKTAAINTEFIAQGYIPAEDLNENENSPASFLKPEQTVQATFAESPLPKQGLDENTKAEMDIAVEETIDQLHQPTAKKSIVSDMEEEALLNQIAYCAQQRREIAQDKKLTDEEKASKEAAIEGLQKDIQRQYDELLDKRVPRRQSPTPETNANLATVVGAAEEVSLARLGILKRFAGFFGLKKTPPPQKQLL